MFHVTYFSYDFLSYMFKLVGDVFDLGFNLQVVVYKSLMKGFVEGLVVVETFIFFMLEIVYPTLGINRHILDDE